MFGGGGASSSSASSNRIFEESLPDIFPLPVHFEWTTIDGASHSATVLAPNPLNGSPLTSSNANAVFSDFAVRKALALTKFVFFQEEYMTSDRDEIDVDSLTDLDPAKLNEAIATAEQWAARATQARAELMDEVGNICGDSSLTTNNQIFPDTLKQIADLEAKDVLAMKAAAERAVVNSSEFDAAAAALQGVDGGASIPNDFLCPITRELMRDPVILMDDGFSYERAAIEDWLKLKSTSPKTNKPTNGKLAPNRSLKALIADAAARAASQEATGRGGTKRRRVDEGEGQDEQQAATPVNHGCVVC